MVATRIGTSVAASVLAPLPTAAGGGWSAISLFCGGGGFDLGLHSEGVSARTAYDNSRAALLSYGSNLPGETRRADLSRHLPDDHCDVLLAGAPCQGFSTAGKNVADDPRNDLLSRIGEAARRMRPTVIVLENVPAALSSLHGRHWRSLEEWLRLDGYNTATIALRGEESGIAQRRRRIFMICWRGRNDTRIELPIVAAPSLRRVLAGVDQLGDHDPSWPAPGSTDDRIARVLGPGQKLCNVRMSPNAVATWMIPDVFGATSDAQREVLTAVSRLRRRERRRSFGDGDPVALERIDGMLGRPTASDVDRLVAAGFLRFVDGMVELRQTYNGKYRRLSWNDPSPTVDTHFGRMSLFMHPDGDRGLSPREAARIQGFPDAYRLTGTRQDQFRTLGNAVPPPMASRLATFVREAILKR